MIDIEAQVAYWRAGAEEDWQVARELLVGNRVRHALFMAHLALEKVLKAHVCRRTQDLAPRIHDLLRLADLAVLNLDQEQRDVLGRMNAFNIHGRYPGLPALPALEQTRAYLAGAEGVFKWLMSLL